MDKVKSRKLWMTAVLIVGMAGLNYTGSVTSSDFTEFVKWALGIYVAGNVGSKFGKMKE